jgi:DNA polymerase-3 subunit epsilon
MNFIALDFETANADLSSVCQVGLVRFENGEPTETLSCLVDPDDYFSPINVSIHGIDENAVSGAPKFTHLHSQVYQWLQGNVVASHSFFDRSVLKQAESRHQLPTCECTWLDTTRVVRRAWPQYARAGYGLKNLATDFGIDFRHHDAAEDARATGLILVRAIRETGMALEEWMVCVSRRIGTTASSSIAHEGKPEGPLHGEVAVFTGALSISRQEAANLAAIAGCEVDTGVTKKTTLLIAGDQDVRHLAAGQSKSAKHAKAEELIAKGQPIRILRETDFLSLCQGG